MMLCYASRLNLKSNWVLLNVQYVTYYLLTILIDERPVGRQWPIMVSTTTFLKVWTVVILIECSQEQFARLESLFDWSRVNLALKLVHVKDLLYFAKIKRNDRRQIGLKNTSMGILTWLVLDCSFCQLVSNFTIWLLFRKFIKTRQLPSSTIFNF